MVSIGTQLLQENARHCLVTRLRAFYFMSHPYRNQWAGALNYSHWEVVEI